MSVRLTQIGVYVEVSGKKIRLSQIGVYVEVIDRQIRLEQIGLYVEVLDIGLLPGEDVTVGGWANETSGSILYPSINDISVNDSTYVAKTSPSVDDYFEVLLYDTVAPSLGTQAMEVVWRAYNAGDGTLTMKCELREGDTIIASDEQVLSGTPTTYTFTLTQEEFDNINNEEDLRLRFTVTGIT